MSGLFKFNETSVKGGWFYHLIAMEGLVRIEAVINKKEHSCSVDFYFTASNVE
jgi:hypothetical protein